MSVVNNEWIKWSKVAGISLFCSLALIGCNRADPDDAAESADAVSEQQIADDNAVALAMSCDDPLVQDRLRTALRSTLGQQAQALAVNYNNDLDVNISNGVIATKVNGVLIDVQNAALLQDANNNGVTTCQASVSMTLASEDLYQASQMHTAMNKPSLQTRLAQNNIRVNNNMLVDDAFSYVIGTQGGQVQARIAGQPMLISVIADVIAGSASQAIVDQQRTIREEQAAAQRRAEVQPTQPRATTPVQPVTPTRQVTPPSINQNNEPRTSSAPVANSEPRPPAPPEVPKVVPSDESIDMIIVEDDTATY